MNLNMKRQLCLSISLLCVVILTLWFWYDNFIFHTYIDHKQYQVCYSGINQDLQLDSFELYQNKEGSYFGNGRLMALKNDMFLIGDRVEVSYSLLKQDDKRIDLKQVYDIKNHNEVLLMDFESMDDPIDFNYVNGVECLIKIVRDGDVVYNQNIPLKKVQLVTYVGNNKDYSLHHVYVTSSWLKTGVLSFDKHLMKKYDLVTMDYLILKDGGDFNNIDDYERFAHVSLKLKDMLKNPLQQAYFYDREDSLLDKDICCVISLKKNELDKKPLVFKIDLHKALQKGDNHA